MARFTPLIAATLALAAFAGSAAWAADPESLGRFRDWEAFSAKEGNATICYASTSPQEQKGDYTSRGATFLMLIRRPAEGVYDDVTAIAGYDYQANSKPTLQVGTRRFEADARGDVAWPKVGDRAQLVAAMKGGSTLELSGVSSRGTPTEDTFSLLGFTAAAGAIAKSCPKR
jgi:hypothetical protein